MWMLQTLGLSRVGIVIRDSHGDMVAAFSKFLSVGSSFRAELLAMLHGLQFCVQHHYLAIQVESDSLSLRLMLMGTMPYAWVLLQSWPRFHKSYVLMDIICIMFIDWLILWLMPWPKRSVPMAFPARFLCLPYHII